MRAIISLLRGVNVGGHNQIKMDALRLLYADLKLHDPQTYVQSGNVVFASAQSNLPRLAKQIEDRIEKECGFRTDVILRTAEEMRAVVQYNPFAKRPDLEPARLLVTFLGRKPEPAARERVLQIRAEPEELHVGTLELYTYFPNGMARPKLSMAKVERTLAVPCSGRNWNTVTKLLAMAEEIA